MNLRSVGLLARQALDLVLETVVLVLVLEERHLVVLFLQFLLLGEVDAQVVGGRRRRRGRLVDVLVGFERFGGDLVDFGGLVDLVLEAVGLGDRLRPAFPLRPRSRARSSGRGPGGSSAPLPGRTPSRTWGSAPAGGPGRRTCSGSSGKSAWRPVRDWPRRRPSSSRGESGGSLATRGGRCQKQSPSFPPAAGGSARGMACAQLKAGPGRRSGPHPRPRRQVDFPPRPDPGRAGARARPDRGPARRRRRAAHRRGHARLWRGGRAAGRGRLAGRAAAAALSSPQDVVDCGNAGTGVRLIMGAAAGFPISRHLHRRRLPAPPADAAGAGPLVADGRALPLPRRRTAAADPEGRRPAGIAYRLPDGLGPGEVGGAAGRAQRRRRRPRCIEPEPTRDHTERMLRAFGAEVDGGGRGRRRASSASPAARR